MGVTRQTIVAIEKQSCSPSLELAFRIARVFGVNVEEVFSMKKDNTAPTAEVMVAVAVHGHRVPGRVLIGISLID